MRRRGFITLLVGAAAAWPLTSRAQERTARVGALMTIAETDSESERLVGGIRDGTQRSGMAQGSQS